MGVGTRRAVVKGTGGYLPERVVTNEDLSKMVDTSDEWITARTGIKERRFAAEDQKTSDLAIAAADNALTKAGLSGSDIDLIVLATATPDNTFPATATKVQEALGTKGAAFDVQAVCTGFVYATATANNFIAMGQADRALVIGAETFSRILDFEDRTTCVLFGDGAGAMVLEAQDGSGDTTDRGVLATKLHSDGAHHDLLYVDGGVSSTGTIGHLRMEGPEVFKHAVTNLAGVTTEVLDQLGLSADDIDWVVPHQANKRIIDRTVKKLGIAQEKVILTVDHHGNTSAASVPLALSEADAKGSFSKGDLLLLEAMGGGFTWGAALLRW